MTYRPRCVACKWLRRRGGDGTEHPGPHVGFRDARPLDPPDSVIVVPRRFWFGVRRLVMVTWQ